MTRCVPVHFSITEAFIAEKDANDILEPMWWSVEIYEGPDAYDKSLEDLTTEQAEFHALLWYQAEVNNGGHHQFFFNSTGVVWQNALAGLVRLGLEDQANNLRAACDRIGGSPALDREQRSEQLDALPDGEDDDPFEPEDDTFYRHEREAGSIDQLMLPYLRAHPAAFLFEGVVQKPAD